MPPMPRDLVRKSKHLSWLLRHGARESGLPMDAAGWCAVDDVLQRTGLARAELEEVVQQGANVVAQMAELEEALEYFHGPQDTAAHLEDEAAASAEDRPTLGGKKRSTQRSR